MDIVLLLLFGVYLVLALFELPLTVLSLVGTALTLLLHLAKRKSAARLAAGAALLGSGLLFLHSAGFLVLSLHENKPREWLDWAQAFGWLFLSRWNLRVIQHTAATGAQPE
jgi:hypothetical protein